MYNNAEYMAMLAAHQELSFETPLGQNQPFKIFCGSARHNIYLVTGLVFALYPAKFRMCIHTCTVAIGMISCRRCSSAIIAKVNPDTGQ